MSIELTVMSLDLDNQVLPRTAKFKKSEVTIGRADGCDLVLTLPEISKSHAKLSLKQDPVTDEPRLFVTDLGSINGTIVDDVIIESMEEVPLMPNQRIQIGRYLIKPALAGQRKERKNRSTFLNRIKKTHTKEGDETTMETSGNAREIIKSIEQKLRREIHDNSSDDTTKIFDDELFDAEPTPVERKAQEPHAPKKQRTVPRKPVPEPKKDKPMQALTNEPSINGRVIDADVRAVDFVARQLFTVSGRVVHRSKPLAGVEIDAGVLGKTVTDEKGYYYFNDVPEGTEFQIIAAKNGFTFDQRSFG